MERISDMRVAFDDAEVNAVAIATPEHRDALATVWACQAGKDVHVEKNPSICIGEGRKMIEAARKYKRICRSASRIAAAPTRPRHATTSPAGRKIIDQDKGFFPDKWHQPNFIMTQ